MCDGSFMQMQLSYETQCFDKHFPYLYHDASTTSTTFLAIDTYDNLIVAGGSYTDTTPTTYGMFVAHDNEGN
jgi:hypothetical protein